MQSSRFQFDIICLGVNSTANHRTDLCTRAIVDPACEINFTLDQAEYQCYKNNKVFTSTQSIFPTSFEQSSSIILPQNMGKAEIRWMDGAEKMD